MKQTYEFYDAQAREAASEAEKATLPNVRQRCIRAERTWRGLAEQARGAAVERANAKLKREARREAENIAIYFGE